MKKSTLLLNALMKKWLTGILTIIMANAPYAQSLINLNDLSEHFGDSVYKAKFSAHITFRIPKNAPTLLNIGAAVRLVDRFQVQIDLR